MRTQPAKHRQTQLVPRACGLPVPCALAVRVGEPASTIDKLLLSGRITLARNLDGSQRRFDHGQIVLRQCDAGRPQIFFQPR